MDKMFTEFAGSSEQEWKEKILKDLKGKSADELNHISEVEGIEISALHSNERSDFTFSFRSSNDWIIIEDFEPFDDPISKAAAGGNKVETTEIESFTSNLTDHLNVNALYYSHQGASCIDELTYTLGQINEYLLHTDQNAIKPKALTVQVGIGENFYLNIAKFRALRILCLNLLKQYKLNAAVNIEVTNTPLYYSRIDIDSNILRATTQCMSAVLGGCDSIGIIAHNMLSFGDREFGERIARNVQLLLKHEAHLDKLADPAAGSYFFESLTKELAQCAWTGFKKLENQGGLIDLIDNGKLNEQLENSFQTRLKEIQDKKTVLIGINKYQPDIESTGSGVPSSYNFSFARNLESAL